MMRRLAFVVAATFLATGLGGCSFWNKYVIPTGSSTTDPGPMIPNDTVNISPSVTIPLESIFYWGVYSSIAYLVIDPLAPNWEIKQASFPDNHVKLTLKMKRVYAGGAGEARQVFQNREIGRAHV